MTLKTIEIETKFNLKLQCLKLILQILGLGKMNKKYYNQELNKMYFSIKYISRPKTDLTKNESYLTMFSLTKKLNI